MISNRRTLSILGQSLLALTMGSALAYAQAPASVSLPISYQRWLQLKADPAAMSLFKSYPAATVVPQVAAGVVAGPWQSATPLPTAGVTPANPLLMTDGTVIVHLIANGTPTTPPEGTRNWLRLTPDINGKYVSGTWSTFATLPVIGGVPYGPIFFASEVLQTAG
jgi:hypothetical protein